MIRKGFLPRLLRRIHAIMTREMKTWETTEGVHFLKRVGVKQGQTVIDFGCGVGHYSIPAAVVTGPLGIVYAVEKDRGVLAKLKRKATSRNLANLKTIGSLKAVTLKFEDGSSDVVLLYDMLHYLPADERKALYSEVSRVLRNTGLLSVYPKHLAGDCPADHFKFMNMQELTREIEKAGFTLEDRLEGIMSHDNRLVQGRVLNFRKK